MKKYILELKYVYSALRFGEEIDGGVLDERVAVGEGVRFKLYSQEDSSFTVGEIGNDSSGAFAILTYPNKDRVVLREDAPAELAYSEYYETFGDSNHNVYIGTVTLTLA